MFIPSFPYYLAGQNWRATDANNQADGILFAVSMPQCVAYRSAAGTIVDNTRTLLALQSEIVDNDAMHDSTTNPARVIAQTAGYYDITAYCTFQGAATGYRNLQVRKNAAGSVSGGTLLTVASKASLGAGVPVDVYTSFTTYLALGDYVELNVFQNSGGSVGLDVSLPSNNGLEVRRCAT